MLLGGLIDCFIGCLVGCLWGQSIRSNVPLGFPLTLVPCICLGEFPMILVSNGCRNSSSLITVSFLILGRWSSNGVLQWCMWRVYGLFGCERGRGVFDDGCAEYDVLSIG